MPAFAAVIIAIGKRHIGMIDKRDFCGAGVVITGAGSGVGAAACAAFAELGAKVLLVGRDENKLRQTQQQLAATSKTAKAETVICPGDIGESAFCERLLDVALERFGRLDVVVNNAGQICRGAARRMKNGGAIVNVASTAGLAGVANLSAYCASKGGVVQLTRALAMEFAGSHISVNAVCPGAIESPMLFSAHPPQRTDKQTRDMNINQIPARRLATAAETARAIVFLATEPHITGTMLPVDGGYTAR
ncbi:MAG: SDR family NAD(P)-dependent oxidoreductase [Gammaproteobacteria bacterium]